MSPNRLTALTCSLVITAFILGLFLGVAVANKIPQSHEHIVQTKIK